MAGSAAFRPLRGCSLYAEFQRLTVPHERRVFTGGQKGREGKKQLEIGQHV